MEAQRLQTSGVDSCRSIDFHFMLAYALIYGQSFIQATSSQAKLDISLAHAKKVFTYFQVMPSYIDFISVFTVKRRDDADVSDLRFSSFRERVCLGPSGNRLNVPHLSLSGRGFHISYNIKCVANTKREFPRVWNKVADDPDAWEWSTRQGAFHHQFDMKEGTTLWIMTAARKNLQKRVQKLVGQKGEAKVQKFPPSLN